MIERMQKALAGERDHLHWMAVKMLHLPFSELYCSSGTRRKKETWALSSFGVFPLCSPLILSRRYDFYSSSRATLSIRLTIIKKRQKQKHCTGRRQCLNVAPQLAMGFRGVSRTFSQCRRRSPLRGDGPRILLRLLNMHDTDVVV